MMTFTVDIAFFRDLLFWIGLIFTILLFITSLPSHNYTENTIKFMKIATIPLIFLIIMDFVLSIINFNGLLIAMNIIFMVVDGFILNALHSSGDDDLYFADDL